MSKICIILALAATASAVLVLLPGVMEHVSHLLHWITIFVSGHHIFDEVAHAIHPKKAPARL